MNSSGKICWNLGEQWKVRKWNFLNFKPGIVGGHCIGVDPYYLIHAASAIDFHSELIFSGRRINDDMPKYIANQFIKKLIRKNIKIHDANVLVIGGTFKENCPDIRNSKTSDVIEELNEYGIKCDLFDPIMNAEEFWKEYNIQALTHIDKKYSGIILLVPHNEVIQSIDEILFNHTSADYVFFDFKNAIVDNNC